MFNGAITALITPFNDGKLDEDRFKQQIERQISKGIDGLVPVGTTGESPTLTFDEHKQVIDLCIRITKGRVPVIAGVGSNNTAEALELHRFAKDVGATAGLSVNPYYNKPSQEGLYRHFMTLGEKVDLPIVLYNIPGRTGITMSAQTIARLHKAGVVTAVKEATGNVDMASAVRELCDITVLSGDDPLTLPLLSLGATGVISVVSNLLPGEIHELVALTQKGDWAGALDLHLKMYPLCKALFLDGNPAGIKAAMAMIGLDSGEMRLPIVDASDATQQAIRDAMSPFNLH